MTGEDNIHPLIKATENALQGLDYDLIFVDDGLTCNTRQKIKELLSDRILFVELRHNYGQGRAVGHKLTGVCLGQHRSAA